MKVFSSSNQILAEGPALQLNDRPHILKIKNKTNFYGLLFYVGGAEDYVELQFEDRLARDQLICQIMEVNGITIK